MVSNYAIEYGGKHSFIPQVLKRPSKLIIEERLEVLHSRSEPVRRSTDIKALAEIKEEKESMEQCLKICAQVSDYIEGVQ